MRRRKILGKLTKFALVSAAVSALAVLLSIEHRVTALERVQADYDLYFGYSSRYPFCGRFGWPKPTCIELKLKMDNAADGFTNGWYTAVPPACDWR